MAGFTDNEILILNREEADLVWRPDTYCSNAKQSDLMLPDKNLHSAIRLSPDGSIFYSRKYGETCQCVRSLIGAVLFYLNFI